MKIHLMILLILCIGVQAQEVTEQSLLGRWFHQGISTTATGTVEPVKHAQIYWVFESDGKGEYQQTVPSRNMKNARPFDWKLSGPDILLSGGKVKYTVVEFEGDKMIWKNERLGDYFHVERQK